MIGIRFSPAFPLKANVHAVSEMGRCRRSRAQARERKAIEAGFNTFTPPGLTERTKKRLPVFEELTHTVIMGTDSWAPDPSKVPLPPMRWMSKIECSLS